MSMPAHAVAPAPPNASLAGAIQRPWGNRLIDALPHTGRARLLRACKTVDLRSGGMLYEPGQRMHHAWFPQNGFVAVLTPTERLSQQAIGRVGNEGMLGSAPVLDVTESIEGALVLDAGTALRIEAPVLRREWQRGRAPRRLLNRYIHVLVTHLARNAACVASHKIEQRLARLLLMSRNRANAETLNLTQACLAAMLACVGRASLKRRAHYSVAGSSAIHEDISP